MKLKHKMRHFGAFYVLVRSLKNIAHKTK